MKKKSIKDNLSLRLGLQAILVSTGFIGLTFVTAGRLDYWQGWFYNGINILIMIVTYIALRSKKDLIKERLKPGKGMKSWDKIYFSLSIPIFFIMIVVSILDKNRYFWYPKVPLAVIFLGITIYLIGYVINIWARKTNYYFSSVVRIQSDRMQKVCREGPYKIIRHPGYLGVALYTFGTPLLLGSYWGLIPSMNLVLLIFIRTYLEDKTLQNELEGYINYKNTVKYRIIPHIW